MSGIANWFNGINHLFLFDRLGIISGALRFMILWVDPDVLSSFIFFALTVFFPFKLLIFFFCVWGYDTFYAHNSWFHIWLTLNYRFTNYHSCAAERGCLPSIEYPEILAHFRP